MKDNKRLEWVDSLRGFAMFLVIMGHVIQFGLLKKGYTDDITWNMIYSFHMPLLFFISGFVTKKKEQVLILIKKRLGQLMIPFCSWMLIRMIWEHNFTVYRFHYFFINPSGGGLWFLWALFFIAIVDAVVTKWFRTNGKYVAVSFAVFCLFLYLKTFHGGKYGIDEICNYYLFYVIGGLVKKIDIKKWPKMLDWRVLLFAFLLSFLFQYYCLDKRTNFTGNIFDYITASLAVIGLWKLWQQERIFPPEQIICKVGRSTLGIYASHYYFIFCFFHFLTIDYSVVMLTVITIFIVFCSYLLTRILNQFTITRIVFLGDTCFLKKTSVIIG